MMCFVCDFFYSFFILKVSISFECILLVLASTLWLTGHQRGSLEQGPKLKFKVPSVSVRVRESLHWVDWRPLALTRQDVVHLAVHPSGGEKAFGLEEVNQWTRHSGRRRAEWARGEMVREGCEELSQESEEDRPARWTGESYHHAELQYKMCHHPQVYQSWSLFKMVSKNIPPNRKLWNSNYFWVSDLFYLLLLCFHSFLW